MKNTHLLHLHYANFGTHDIYMCCSFFELSWKHKLQNFKQDWVMFKSAGKHRLELQLHLMKAEILTDLMF